MKDIQELVLPEGVRYAKDHEWAKSEGDLVRIGVSDYAQDQLGALTFVELPAVGTKLDAGQEFGVLESTKAVSELFMPVGGEVVEANGELENNPEKINEDPYGGGWMIVIRPSDPAELDALMDRNAYVEMLKGLE